MIKNYVWFVHGHSFDRFSSFQSNQRDTLQLTSAKLFSFFFCQQALIEMSTFDVENFHARCRLIGNHFSHCVCIWYVWCCVISFISFSPLTAKIVLQIAVDNALCLDEPATAIHQNHRNRNKKISRNAPQHSNCVVIAIFCSAWFPCAHLNNRSFTSMLFQMTNMWNSYIVS